MVAASAVLFGSKTERQQPAAEVRPHDALAGRREQHLLDQIANVIGIAQSRAVRPRPSKRYGKVDVAHSVRS